MVYTAATVNKAMDYSSNMMKKLHRLIAHNHSDLKDTLMHWLLQSWPVERPLPFLSL